MRPVRHPPDGKKPDRAPWRGLCAAGVRSGTKREALGLSEQAESLPARRIASAAANFAAKEAFLKAAGTGLAGPFALAEIQAVRLPSGAPAYRFSGRTAQWVAQRRLTAHLTLSHDGGMAMAGLPAGEQR